MSKEKEIDRLFNFIEGSHTLSGIGGNKGQSMFGLDYFQNCDFLTLQETWSNYLPEENYKFIDPNASPREVDGRFDYSFVADKSDQDSGEYGLYQFFRFRNLSPKQVRGKVVGFYKYFGEFSVGMITDSERIISSRLIMGSNGNGWRRCDNWGGHEVFGNKDYLALNENELVIAGAAISLSFFKRYVWRASIGIPGGPSVAFPTNVEGARELFKLRDVPEGKKKRSHIKNWVCQHWRHNPEDEDNRIFVRKHLRGAIEFDWKDYKVKILPSEYDIEQNIKYELQREIHKQKELNRLLRMEQGLSLDAPVRP